MVKRTRAVGRPPRKAPGGLDRVLYVRATPELLAGLDRLAAEWARKTGLAVSRSDVARKILSDVVMK